MMPSTNGNGHDLTGLEPAGDIEEMARAAEARGQNKIEGPTLETIGSYEPSDEDLKEGAIANRILQHNSVVQLVENSGLSYLGLVEDPRSRFFLVQIWKGIQMVNLKKAREAELAKAQAERDQAVADAKAERDQAAAVENALRLAMRDILGLEGVDDITASLQRAKADIETEKATEPVQPERQLGNWKKAMREFAQSHPGLVNDRYRSFEPGGLAKLMASLRFWMIRAIRSIQELDIEAHTERYEDVQQMLNQHERWLQHELDVVASVLEALGYSNASEARASFQFRGTVREEVAEARSPFFPLFLSVEELVGWEEKYNSYHVPDSALKAIVDEDEKAELEVEMAKEREVINRRFDEITCLVTERAGVIGKYAENMANSIIKVMNKEGVDIKTACEKRAVGVQEHAQNVDNLDVDGKYSKSAINYLLVAGLTEPGAKGQLTKLFKAKMVELEAEAEERRQADLAKAEIKSRQLDKFVGRPSREREEKPKGKSKGKPDGNNKGGKGRK